MKEIRLTCDRRAFLGNTALGMAGLAALYQPGIFAQSLQQTPRQTEGPFYPDKLPLDTDNDLIIVNDGSRAWRVELNLKTQP